MSRLTKHLDEVDETYLQHLTRAVGFAVAMLVGSVACLVHALLPFLFVKTGSDCIRRLNKLMVENRVRPGEDESATATTTNSSG